MLKRLAIFIPFNSGKKAHKTTGKSDDIKIKKY